MALASRCIVWWLFVAGIGASIVYFGSKNLKNTQDVLFQKCIERKGKVFML